MAIVANCYDYRERGFLLVEFLLYIKKIQKLIVHSSLFKGSFLPIRINTTLGVDTKNLKMVLTPFSDSPNDSDDSRSQLWGLKPLEL